MQTLPIYQVDAFASGPMTGNPAAVVPLGTWLPDSVMLAIAAENNLAETAFLVPLGEGYQLRWFTPLLEVDLCGHATLASAFVVTRFLKPGAQQVVFQSASGPLPVTIAGERLTLDFPVRAPRVINAPAVTEALGVKPLAVLRADKNLALLADEAAVRAARPDMRKVAALEGDGLIITAPGDEVDFVSRYFAPHAGINEDPVTGSAHCVLAPFWSARLGKNLFTAKQVSKRGGDLTIELRGERVLISGTCRLYLEGRIFV